MDLTHRWLRTLTLIERSKLLSPKEHTPTSDSLHSDEVKSAHIEAWSSQAPFGADFPFAKRLAADGLTEETFEQLLTEPIEELGTRFPQMPAWVSDFTEVWSDDTSNRGLPWPQWVTEHNLYGFLQVIEPLVIRYWDQLRSGIQRLAAQYEDLPFDPQTIDSILLAPVPASVFQMAGRTLILEMHIARLRGQLVGETSEARYQRFFEQFRDPQKRSALFEEYVVLAQQLTTYLQDWADGSLEFLQRLCVNWQAIQATFSPDEQPGKLVRFESGLGDRHNSGRTVGIVNFASGLRVVYKPRPQSITLHFQELLTWLNEHDLPLPFHTLKILDQDGYGWVEFVRAQSCQTAEEVDRFYQRQGGYLALLYVLAGTDIHSENLIAVGEYPILIDVETLFHHGFTDASAPGWARPGATALQSSVLRSLLLPARIYADEEQAGIDISGLGAVPSQLSPTPVPIWEDAGTDKMHLARKRVPLPETLNRPTLIDQDVDVSNYLESIVAGFETVYRLLVKHRAEFLSEVGPLARFAADEIRIIVRPTRTYSTLLNESYHPNHLRDVLTRDRLFDYLWKQVPRLSALGHIIAFEKHDLHRGNIPLFTAHPNSRHLWSSSGTCIPDFFAETSMADVQRRFHELSDKDMELQVWFIRASFLSLPAESDTTIQAPASRAVSPSTKKLARERLLDAAQTAGTRLETLAVHYERYVAWMGLKGKTEQYKIVPLDLNFYGGVPGVTFFLAYLGAITGEQRYTSLAERSLFTVQSQVEDNVQSIKLIGAFNGWSGIVYLFTHLAVIWNRPDLFAAADRIVVRISELVEQDDSLDVIGGAAGCIQCLLGLYGCTSSEHVLEIAARCGDHLIAQAKVTQGGTAWLGNLSEPRPLTGFAHGSAGIVWALSALADVTGERRFREIVSSALVYERHAFSSEAQNWHSLRGDKPAQDDMLAWCYGAPGIGLARITSSQTDPEYQSEIEIALQTTLTRGFGYNHSLCHGDLGNLELLLQASQKLNSGYWQAKVDSIANSILDDISQHGWKGGGASVTGTELMTGIAGIGYELLRLAEPTKVPSVLTLAPPILQ